MNQVRVFAQKKKEKMYYKKILNGRNSLFSVKMNKKKN